MKINVLGLASPARYEKDELVAGLKYHQKIWGKNGFIPQIYPSCFQQNYYETVLPELKVKELIQASRLNDPIVVMRGGYSTNLMLDLIDWEELKKDHQTIIGHSDLTILLNHLAFRCDWQVWHGPLFTSVPETDEKSLKLLKKCLNNQIQELKSFSKIDIINPGKCQGKICGGNLSLITGVIGTEYELNFDQKILLLEEVNEPDYKVDAMLYQFTKHYDISKLKGIIIGSLVGCNYEQSEKHLGCRNIIEKYFANFTGPIIGNFSSSHAVPMTSLPLNQLVELDTTKSKIKIIK